MIVDVVIPAFNEAGNVGYVVGDLKREAVRNVVVVDNNSTDETAAEATQAGAVVMKEPIQGYGAACLQGIAWVNAQDEPADVILFCDADHSDDISALPSLIEPITRDRADMVIGSRALGEREPGAMTPQQLFGNWLATRLIRLMYGVRYTDLGPFRAIRRETLNAIGMVDQTYGWTVEMQVKVVKHGFRFTEIPVDYKRRRTGKSKVAGTLKGTILAGYKIIGTIFKYR